MFPKLTKILLAACVAGAAVVSADDVDSDTLNSGIANVLANLEGTRIIPNLLPQSQFALKYLLYESFTDSNDNDSNDSNDNNSNDSNDNDSNDNDSNDSNDNDSNDSNDNDLKKRQNDNDNNNDNDNGHAVGATLPVSQVANKPTWVLGYPDNATFSSTLYTVMTLDPGPAMENGGNVVRHYLANNVTVGDDGNLMNMSDPVAGWFSPAPPAGDGVHRYTTLVFVQPTNFMAPEGQRTRNTTIDTNFNVMEYKMQANLGPVVAATFFLAQNEDTSASTTATGIVSTTSVNSATISNLQNSVSSSLSAAATMTGSNDSDNDSDNGNGNGAASLPASTLGALAMSVGAVVVGALLL